MGKVSSYTSVAEVQDDDLFYVAAANGSSGYLDRSVAGDVAKRQFGAAYAVAADPTAADDEGDGFRAGSLWLNTSDGGVFVCEDATAGYAVWTEINTAASTGVTINTQIGTTYTLVLSDQDKLVTLDNGSAITVTIPTNASVAFPTGTVIAFAQLGAGAVTIEGDTGVTVNGTSAGSEALSAQYATATAVKLATNTWLVSGGLA